MSSQDDDQLPEAPVMDTRAQIVDGQDPNVTFYEALEFNLGPDHGGMDDIALAALKRRWDEAAREYANEHGTVEGHGQKKQTDASPSGKKLYMLCMPASRARLFLSQYAPKYIQDSTARLLTQQHEEQQRAQLAAQQFSIRFERLRNASDAARDMQDDP